MISKIAGNGNFQRISKSKDRKTFIKEQDEKSQKVITENNVPQQESQFSQDAMNSKHSELYLAEFYKAQIRKEALLRGKK